MSNKNSDDAGKNIKKGWSILFIFCLILIIISSGLISFLFLNTQEIENIRLVTAITIK